MKKRYLHLLKNHSADLLSSKQLVLSLDLDHNVGLAVLALETEGEVLGVMLDRRVVPVATNKTLDIKDSVFGVESKLILGSISNQTLSILSKGNIRWRNAVSLVIGDDFDTAVLVHTNPGKN